MRPARHSGQRTLSSLTPMGITRRRCDARIVFTPALDRHAGALEQYAAAHTTAPDGVLSALAEATRAELPRSHMLTGAIEGRLLEMLVFALRPQLVLEVGTYSGYSALAMASVLTEGGRIVTCELSDEFADFAQRHFDASPYADVIEIRRGSALETIADLPGPFDLVFIDADKPSYGRYYEAIVPKLSERGLMVVDNTLWQGNVVDDHDADDNTRVIREFNDGVLGDPRVVSVMLTMRDGITLIRPAMSPPAARSSRTA
jgi:caffeoyl-CoA O-methyltransferase